MKAPYPKVFDVRGEVYMEKSEFAKYNADAEKRGHTAKSDWDGLESVKPHWRQRRLNNSIWPLGWKKPPI